jgi:NAD(P)-dependent dehydrogenase (short-subunit alcohol dehydrogenase family)
LAKYDGRNHNLEKMVIKDIFDLSGRVALITGGGSGLGRAFCQAMAKYGANVACIGRTEQKLKDTIGIISCYGHRSIAIKADVSIPEQVENMVNETLAKLGKIDILINNAGVAGTQSRIHKTSLEDWDRIMSTDLRGVFLCMREVLPIMLKQKKGSIINISSTFAFGSADPKMASAAYSVAKAGINNLTKCAAVEYAKDGIRVNCIAPGIHPTGIEKSLGLSVEKLEKFTRKLIARNVPMGRGGKPEELEGLAVFLASDASSFVTGEVFAQDGGQLAKI